MGSIAVVSILFISAFLSGAAVFFIKRDNAGFLKLILAFSGAYLFAITVLHLIPHVYLADDGQNLETIGLYILGGFLFQIVLEQFSHGIEHGHVHKPNTGLHIFPLGIMISLCLHAFIEGMPLASEHQDQLVFGIAIHHVPAAFALGSLLINTRLSKTGIYLMIGIFAIMTPMGYLLSKWLSTGGVSNIEQYFSRLMAIVIGIFLHISTTILFETGSEHHHHFNRRKMIAVLVGIAIALLNFAFDGHSHDHHSHDHHGHEHHGHDHHHEADDKE